MRVPPPVVMVATGVVQLATPRRRGSRAVRATGAGVLVAGSGALAGAAARSFRRSGTTVEPFRPERASTLVTSGANSVTRNPMYVGMAGVLLAHALQRGSWIAVVPVAAFVAVIDRYQVRFEEEALRERFGADYHDYCRDAPRWLDGRSLPAARRQLRALVRDPKRGSAPVG